MGARIRVLLNPEENRTLFELRTATTVPQRVMRQGGSSTLECAWLVRP
jgi:hypothetical protein